ncbi:uncharacterized protein LOC133532535 [Cydia pomonella]|uniref:uncharacterized protein LOC133532535 n=1 Tax=Cydia pomonella TaxID=82600 RepID=UPI002ADD502D|nr:uncharacterized protein LOC133532535 [Cydia pomonella]
MIVSKYLKNLPICLFLRTWIMLQLFTHRPSTLSAIVVRMLLELARTLRTRDVARLRIVNDDVVGVMTTACNNDTAGAAPEIVQVYDNGFTVLDVRCPDDCPAGGLALPLLFYRPGPPPPPPQHITGL